MTIDIKKKNELLVNKLNHKLAKSIFNNFVFKFFFNKFYDVDKIIDNNGDVNKEYLKKKKIYHFYIFIKQNFLITNFGKKKYINIFILNFLGFQIMRILYFQLLAKIKNIFYFFSEKKKNELKNLNYFDLDDLKNLDRDGLLIKSDFITKVQSKTLLDFFKYNEKNSELLNNQNHITRKLEIKNFNGELNFVKDIEFKIRQLVCISLKKSITNETPQVSIFEDYYEIYKKNISDHQDLFHTDVPYDTFKAFIYLNDISRDNGAFSYIIGSHKISINRLISEYLGSINIRKGQDNWEKNLPFKLYQRKRVEYCERDSGSLVLANTSGYHARGPFNTSKEKRYILYFNYRYLS